MSVKARTEVSALDNIKTLGCKNQPSGQNASETQSASKSHPTQTKCVTCHWLCWCLEGFQDDGWYDLMCSLGWANHCKVQTLCKLSSLTLWVTVCITECINASRRALTKSHHDSIDKHADLWSRTQPVVQMYGKAMHSKLHRVNALDLSII